MDVTHVVLIGAAAVAAGAINAIAGGGSLITFPTLVACGVPAIVANMTNTVALFPGYLSATWAQRNQLAGQRTRVLQLLPLSLAGSLAGAWILMHTSARAFEEVVPFLLVFAAALLAVQGRVRRYLAGRTRGHHSLVLATLPVGIAAIYGAYFGAGLGVILLAILGAVIDDTLIRANALKQLLSLAINTCAAIVFVAFRPIDWPVVAVVAAGSLVGGVIGGMLASRIREAVLRWIAIAVSLAVAAVYFARL